MTIASLESEPDTNKVDVQGAEHLVLEGTWDVLTTSQQDVFVEVYRTNMVEFGHSQYSQLGHVEVRFFETEIIEAG